MLLAGVGSWSGKEEQGGTGDEKIAGGLGGAPFMCRRAWDTISKNLSTVWASTRGVGGGAPLYGLGQLGQPVQRDHPQKAAHRSPPKFPSPIGADVAKPTWEPALLQPWEAPGRCSTVICRASTWIPSTKRISRRGDPS